MNLVDEAKMEILDICESDIIERVKATLTIIENNERYIQQLVNENRNYKRQINAVAKLKKEEDIIAACKKMNRGRLPERKTVYGTHMNAGNYVPEPLKQHEEE